MSAAAESRERGLKPRVRTDSNCQEVARRNLSEGRIKKIERLFVEDIEVGNRLRPIDEAAVVALAESMQVRVSLAVIREWRGQFFAALGRVEATDIAAKAAEGPRGPDVVPLAKRTSSRGKGRSGSLSRSKQGFKDG